MLMLRSRNALLGLALIALLVPSSGRAQERTVVSKEISVGSSAATMRLEFSEGAPLEISLQDGSVVVDGETAGTYTTGDALDVAWRALLGEAVTLEDGALAEALSEWMPPEGLDGDRLELASEIQETMTDALTMTASATLPSGESISVRSDLDGSLVRALLERAGRLSALSDALKGLGDDIQLHVSEDVVIDAGETVEGSLVIVEGTASIAGTVDGDVVVVDGTLELLEGGLVTGDVRLADATFDTREGTLDGDVLNVINDDDDTEAVVRDRIRSEVRRELSDRAGHGGYAGGPSFFNPFRSLFRAVSGAVGNLLSVFILALVGMGVVALWPENLDAVAETARTSPGRSAMVGLAGTFLLLPVWVLGIVALAITIVGIPVMIAWVPLFPLAAMAAALLGYLAVARNVGAWLADSNYRYTDWIRKSSSVYLITGGLLGLASFFIAAHVFSILPMFGLFTGLLRFVGGMFTLVALQIGFGAVLLTRGGRRREYFSSGFDDAWERAADAEADVASATASAASGSGNGGGDDA